MDSTIVISWIVNGVIKPIILMLIIALLWLCVRKKSAALQHFVLSLGLISVLLLPLLASLLPTVEAQVAPMFAKLIQVPQEWISRLMPLVMDFIGERVVMIVAGLYLLPATWLLFYLALGVYGLVRIVARAELVRNDVILAQVNELRELLDISRSVKIMISDEVSSPQTWGLWRPVIMLPREALLWEEEKILSVFVHELGHIVRWDWLITLLVKITCACFWFLLPIWFLAQALYQQAEIACDDYIYKLHDKHIAYAKNLLSFANAGENKNINSDALYMRGSSPIYLRIMSVLDRQRSHRPVPVEAAQYWLILSVLLVVLFSCVQLVPLQAQLNERAGRIVQLKLPLQKPVAIDSSAIKVEQFSWELMQKLKPKVQSVPAQIENLEHVAIHVARPSRQELQGWDAMTDGHKKSLAIPAIHIQGFLPIVMVTPEYPAQALAKGIEGWVEATYSINANGKIIDAYISAHSPSGIFDRNVLRALKKSSYRPQLLDGQPVVVQGVTELFRFTLTDIKQNDSSTTSPENNQFGRQSIDHRRR